ncbi:MAG: precorrin-3B C(17)-methyltransferase [Prevotella sp.]|nr:precorrin-3B C(17)-methyltransferase [Prevotella sp.]
MGKPKITVVGIGPGSPEDITPAVLQAVKEADVVVGYKYYFQFIQQYVREGCPCIDTGMKRERDRALQAFELAEQGKNVVVISSGDAGIYGMAPLIYEMASERRVESGELRVEIVSLPGISAFQKAASLLGAPMGHDFCVISLSDLMTPWAKIEKRIVAAAEADFVTAIYNPKSNGRYWQLHRLKELFLKSRSEDTPVGFVRQAGREEQVVHVTTLKDFDPEDVDMFTVVIIGNSQSYVIEESVECRVEREYLMITPRGYYREVPSIHTEKESTPSPNKGQEIMMESFRTIASELQQPDIPIWRKWPLLHAIHTTADFSMEDILYTDKEAVPRIYQAMTSMEKPCIITDVTMAASGIRKAACERLGIEVKCYLHDERVAEMAQSQNITRTQAGIRLAVEEHPEALFAFGNAPTALMELCDLMRKKKARPAGIIAAPVGFVHVCESKYMVKVFHEVPKIIIEGRKGGSNLAATLVNSILAWPDAELLKPGRDV